MKSKMSRSGKGKIALVVSVIIILACVGLCVFAFFKFRDNLEGDYSARINELQTQLATRSKIVYVAAEDIKAGTMIEENLLVTKEVITDAADYITADDFGKTFLVDIPAGTEIKKPFVSGVVVDTELREVEYDYITVSSNVGLSDYVDVRILYPDGTDYIVLSKKQIKGLNETKLVCDLWVTEEEILMMDSAAVDAYLYKDINALYKDAKIYVTKYIMPTVQEPSVPNFVPSEQVAAIIRENPNIVNIASQYLSDELRKKRELELNSYLIIPGSSGLTWYDSTGRYLGKATEAEVMGNDLVNNTGSIPGSELPEEYGTGLWDDLETR